MKEYPSTIKTAAFFAVFTVVVFVLYRVVGIPTTARMNFALMAYGLGSTAALLVAMVFPVLRALVITTIVGWGIAIAAGVMAFFVTIVCGIGQLAFPLVSFQWYALAMAMGFIGACVIKCLVNDCNEEIYYSYLDQNHEAGEKAREMTARTTTSSNASVV